MRNTKKVIAATAAVPSALTIAAAKSLITGQIHRTCPGIVRRLKP